MGFFPFGSPQLLPHISVTVSVLYQFWKGVSVWLFQKNSVFLFFLNNLVNFTIPVGITPLITTKNKQRLTRYQITGFGWGANHPVISYQKRFLLKVLLQKNNSWFEVPYFILAIFKTKYQFSLIKLKVSKQIYPPEQRLHLETQFCSSVMSKIIA